MEKGTELCHLPRLTICHLRILEAYPAKIKAACRNYSSKQSIYCEARISTCGPQELRKRQNSLISLWSFPVISLRYQQNLTVSSPNSSPVWASARSCRDTFSTSSLAACLALCNVISSGNASCSRVAKSSTAKVRRPRRISTLAVGTRRKRYRNYTTIQYNII